MQASRPQYPPDTYLSAAEHNEGITSNYLPPGFACGTNFSWTQITLAPTDFGNVDFPAVHYAGWYDIFLSPQLDTFRGYDTLSAQGARGQQQMFVDPRGHCFFEVRMAPFVLLCVCADSRGAADHCGLSR